MGPGKRLGEVRALRNYLSWARDVNHAAEKLLHDCEGVTERGRISGAPRAQVVKTRAQFRARR